MAAAYVSPPGDTSLHLAHTQPRHSSRWTLTILTNWHGSSFLAGILPLSMPLTQSQLRLLSSIGVGILVGTSLIVIIPEGIEAIATTGMSTHSHGTREAPAMPEPSPSWEAPKMARYQPGNTLGRAEKAGRAVIGSEHEDTLSGFLDDIRLREVIHVRRDEKDQEPRHGHLVPFLPSSLAPVPRRPPGRDAPS